VVGAGYSVKDVKVQRAINCKDSKRTLTKATTDFLKTSEPTPSPSQLPPTSVKEAQQVPQAPEIPKDQALEESFMDWAAASIFEIKNEKCMLRKARQELEAREARLFEVEEKYRDILHLIRDCAETENVDLRTECCRVGQYLRMYRQVGSLQMQQRRC
jgi:hypothetical protein